MDFFDLHCDTPYECYTKALGFNSDKLAVSANAAECFKNWRQVFAVWIRDDIKAPFELYKTIISDFKEKLFNKPENLKPYFAVEGGAVLETDIERLFELKKDSISFLTLVWNGENALAGGNESEKGLTELGRRAVLLMNELKIGCDLSHINEKGFYKAVEYSDFPLATHSNCRALCNHKRNLSDEQIDLIAQKGGIIGLCFYPEFLGQNPMGRIYDQIVYLCDKGYENNIAIGSDFDGAKMDASLNKTEKVPALFSYLEQKGFEKQLLNKIFYKNAYNFIAKLE